MITIESLVKGDVVIMNKRSSKNIKQLPKGIYYAVIRDGNEFKAVKPFYKK